MSDASETYIDSQICPRCGVLWSGTQRQHDEFCVGIESQDDASETPRTIQEIIDRSSHCTATDGAGNYHSCVKAKIADLRIIEAELAGTILGSKNNFDLWQKAEAEMLALEAKHRADLELAFRDHDLDVKDLEGKLAEAKEDCGTAWLSQHEWMERAESAEARLREALDVVRELVEDSKSGTFEGWVECRAAAWESARALLKKEEG